MLSEDSIKQISSIFCGDTDGYYSYKSGPKLVSFFNTKFGYNDMYGQGFPSRWIYVYNKIVDLINKGKINDFFNLILSKQYIMSELKCSEVEAISHIDKIYNEFQRILKLDFLVLVRKNGKYIITEEDKDLILIGSGGFANVYLQKSTGKIVKKLKEDFLMNSGIRSRFKREFQLTKNLNDIPTIIKVFDFNEDTCSYTMEKAEQTLEHFVQENELTEEIKITCIRQILHTMKQVHERNIIHRDISPNNIFILNGLIKIADFGLGKDLNMFTSHNSYLTNALGQFHYCAPEQFMLLRDGDKRSDVYSLGRLINFIMTGDCTNYNHIFKAVTEKATSSNVAFRQADAGVLLDYIEKSIKYHREEQNQEIIFMKISKGILDIDIENFLSELTGDQICKKIIDKKPGFSNIIIQYMKQDPKYANNIIQRIEDNFRNICRNFADYDPFATLSYNILKDNSFEYTVKEIAAGILSYVAYDVNRFYAQDLIKAIMDYGVEPMIEEILQR